MSLEKAIELAKLNPIKPRGRNSISRFSAILTDGNIAIVGNNSYRTHPLQKRFSINDECIHIHAEIDAIAKVTRLLAKCRGQRYPYVDDLSDWKMYVARVLKDGTPSIARPCEGCWRAITAFGIKSVEWTT